MHERSHEFDDGRWLAGQDRSVRSEGRALGEATQVQTRREHGVSCGDDALLDADFESTSDDENEPDSRQGRLWRNCSSRYLYEAFPRGVHGRGGLASEISERHDIAWQREHTERLARYVVGRLKARWHSVEDTELGEQWDPASLLGDLLMLAAGRDLGPPRGRLPEGRRFEHCDEAVRFLNGILANWQFNEHRSWKTRMDARLQDVRVEELDGEAEKHPPTPVELTARSPESALKSLPTSPQSPQSRPSDAELVQQVADAFKDCELRGYPQEFLYWFDFFESQFMDLQLERNAAGTDRRDEIAAVASDHLGSEGPLARFPGLRQYVRRMLGRWYADPTRGEAAVDPDDDRYLENLRAYAGCPRGEIPASFFDDDNEYQAVLKARDRACFDLVARFRDSLGIDSEESQ